MAEKAQLLSIAVGALALVAAIQFVLLPALVDDEDEDEDEDDAVMSVAENCVRNIPQHNQAQFSLDEQLRILKDAANKLGLYDAADFINSMNNQKHVNAVE